MSLGGERPRSVKIKDHFRSEARRMVATPFVLAALGLLAAITVPWLIRQLSVDRCLDAGGRFNYETRTCEGARTQLQ
jgi:hypothetical protein